MNSSSNAITLILVGYALGVTVALILIAGRSRPEPAVSVLTEDSRTSRGWALVFLLLLGLGILLLLKPS